MQQINVEIKKNIAQSAKRVLTTAFVRAIINSVAPHATIQRIGGLPVNVLKLKAKIVENDMNIGKLAAELGVDRSSLYRKLNNCEKITIGEAVKIKEILSLSDTEAYDIFLA